MTVLREKKKFFLIFIWAPYVTRNSWQKCLIAKSITSQQTKMFNFTYYFRMIFWNISVLFWQFWEKRYYVLFFYFLPKTPYVTWNSRQKFLFAVSITSQSRKCLTWLMIFGWFFFVKSVRKLDSFEKKVFFSPSTPYLTRNSW